jgi:hypothetical protein
MHPILDLLLKRASKLAKINTTVLVQVHIAKELFDLAVCVVSTETLTQTLEQLFGLGKRDCVIVVDIDQIEQVTRGPVLLLGSGFGHW